jgi:mannosyltransferase
MPFPQAAAKQSVEASPFPSSFVRWVHRLTLLLVVAAGTIIRLVYLVRKPFWFDECFSVEVARVGWRSFVQLLWWREANMALYYVLLRVWLQFGQTEFYIRSLSVLAAAATLPAIYWLAGLLYNRRVALIATALLCFNAYQVRYAQEARSYALFLLLATLSSGFLIALVREPSRRLRLGYILVSVLAVYAHFYALLLLAAHWLALRWLESRGKADHPSIALLSAQMRGVWKTIGIAVLPLLIFVAKTGGGPIRWIHRPGLHDLFAFYEHLCGGASWPLPAIYTVACIAAVAPFAGQLKARGQSWEVWRSQFLLLWLLFPVVLTAVLSVIRPVFLTRYLIFCLPALLILAAAGLARLRNSWLLAAVLTGVLLLASQGVFFVYDHDFDTERDAAGAATNFVLDHTQPGDAIFFHIPQIRVPYEFYRSVRAGENTASASFTAQVGPEILYPHYGAGLDYRDFRGKLSADFVRAKAPSHPRVWVVLMYNGPKLPDPTNVLLSQVLPETFPKMQRWQFPQAEVRLYSKQ